MRCLHPTGVLPAARKEASTTPILPGQKDIPRLPRRHPPPPRRWIKVETASAAAAEHAEEYGVDEAILSEATNDKGAYTKQLLTAAAREAKASRDGETLACANKALHLVNAETAAKKAAKDAQVALDLATLKKYGDISEVDVKALVLDDKWQKSLLRRVAGEADALTLDLVARIQQLGERYASTVEDLDGELERINGRVAEYLSAMGVE